MNNNSNSGLPSSFPDSEFVELRWEDGQIVMQGQPSRSKKKNPIPTPSSQPTKLQERGDEDCVLQNMCHFAVADDYFSTTGISSQMCSNAQGDDTLTWLNIPMDDYCLEFLSELSGVNTSALPVQNNSMPVDKGSLSGSSEVLRDSHSLDHNLSPKPVNGSSGPRIRNRESNNMPRQSGASDVAARITAAPVCGNSSTWRLPDAKLQRQDPTSPKLPPPPPRPTGSSGLVYFSHFTRPVALLKANLQSPDSLRSNEEASTTTASTAPLEPARIESPGGLKNVSQRGMVALVSDKGDVKSATLPRAELVSGNRPEATIWGNASRDDNICIDKCMSPERASAKGFSSAANLLVSSNCTRNNNSEMVATSSVCSSNGAHTTPNHTKQQDKCKIPEGEDYSYQSEDIDNESPIVKKTARSSGTAIKRRRAAEVHNLSERRRRDRINVKMRALQELIPNCNKVDKASMLDEAIEYLKTLQLQVQIMSMGGGLCVPPVMLPSGVQYLQTPHMAHHHPSMGGGGVGMGHDMGILGMIPPIQGPQSPCSVQGNVGMPGCDGLQLLCTGGQGQSVPITCGVQTRTNTMAEVSLVRDTQMGTCLTDRQMQSLNLDAGGHEVGIDDDTQIQTCKQTAGRTHPRRGSRPMHHTVGMETLPLAREVVYAKHFAKRSRRTDKKTMGNGFAMEKSVHSLSFRL